MSVLTYIVFYRQPYNKSEAIYTMMKMNVDVNKKVNHAL